MRKLVKLIVLLLIITAVNFNGVYCNEITDSKTLQGYIKEIPDDFFGSWRVCAKRIETDSEEIFKEKTVDLWNIFSVGDVIKLRNPFSGASAEITINGMDNKTIRFSKTGKSGNKILTDTVEITIQDDTFTGEDILKLETVSDIDGSIRKISNAKYLIKGERISGQRIKGD